MLTPAAYEHLDRLNDRIVSGCQDVIDRYGLPGYAIGIGSKGCVTFAPVKITDYESFKEHQDAELCDLAWLWNLNRGIFMTPGREEEWTLSVTHTEDEVDLFVNAFDELAPSSRPAPRTGPAVLLPIRAGASLARIAAAILRRVAALELLLRGVELGGTKIVCLVGTGPDDVVDECRIETREPECDARRGQRLPSSPRRRGGRDRVVRAGRAAT